MRQALDLHDRLPTLLSSSHTEDGSHAILRFSVVLCRAHPSGWEQRRQDPLRCAAPNHAGASRRLRQIRTTTAATTSACNLPTPLPSLSERSCCADLAQAGGSRGVIRGST